LLVTQLHGFLDQAEYLQPVPFDVNLLRALDAVLAESLDRIQAFTLLLPDFDRVQLIDLLGASSQQHYNYKQYGN